jgi:glycosyltransferase involved in cell wall biosynthesis
MADPSSRTPLVTVGIPTYNRPEGLRKTLEAICGQSYTNLEILVADNCSPDPEVALVLEEFSMADPRVRFYKQDSNIGAVLNFFSLVDAAKGDFFMWAADDDWWHTDFIRVCVDLLSKSPGAAVVLPRFRPIPHPTGKIRLLPPAFEKIREFQIPGTCQRLSKFIGQKEAFGKAHIIYGLFPLSVIKESVAEMIEIVGGTVDIRGFNKMDILLNAIVLSKGNLVTSETLLREYTYGPRAGGKSGLRALRGVDSELMMYFEICSRLIDRLPVSDVEKSSVRTALKRRKKRYIFERILRKLVVYRLYWSVYKRFHYEKW